MRRDLTGERFGRLVVIEARKHDVRGNQLWWCRCECGVELPVVGYNLKNGNTTSCGCVKRAMNAEVKKRKKQDMRPRRAPVAIKFQRHCDSAHQGQVDPRCNACTELQKKALT